MPRRLDGGVQEVGLARPGGDGDITAALTPERVTKLPQDLRRATILVERCYQEYGQLFERFEPGYRQLGAVRYRAPSL